LAAAVDRFATEFRASIGIAPELEPVDDGAPDVDQEQIVVRKRG
jgi:hypothetical protein